MANQFFLKKTLEEDLKEQVCIFSVSLGGVSKSHLGLLFPRSGIITSRAPSLYQLTCFRRWNMWRRTSDEGLSEKANQSGNRLSFRWKASPDYRMYVLEGDSMAVYPAETLVFPRLHIPVPRSFPDWIWHSSPHCPSPVVKGDLAILNVPYENYRILFSIDATLSAPSKINLYNC